MAYIKAEVQSTLFHELVPIISVLNKRRQKDQKLKVLLGYIVSLKPVWCLQETVSERWETPPQVGMTVSMTADFPVTASTLPGSNPAVPHLYPDCFGDSNSRQMTIRCIGRTYVKAESQATRKLKKL